MFTDAKCPLFLVMKSFCGKKDVIGGQMQIWMKIAYRNLNVTFCACKRASHSCRLMSSAFLQIHSL